MYSLIVRERKILAVFGTLCSLICAGFLIFIVRDGVNKHDTAQILIGGFVFGAMMLLGLAMLMSCALRRLCLGYNGCYYRTMFGRKREFKLQEIAGIECKIVLGDLLIIFYDADGRRLARVENNMINADKIFPFLDDYRLPALKRGISGKHAGSWLQMQKKYDKQLKSRYYPDRQREKRKRIEEEWSGNPAFYENPEWIRRIRRYARILNVVGVIAFLAAVWGSARTEALCYVLYPLAIWVFYLIFHRVLYWDIKTINPRKLKEQYVGMPYLPMIFLLMYAIIRLDSMNIEEMWKMAVLGAVLALGMIFSMRLIRAGGGYAELAIPVFIIFMYCFTGMHYWNGALAVGEPEYIRTEIVEERKSEGTKSDSYYFTLRTEEGEERELSVSGNMYMEAGTGDCVWMCRRVSVFGIHYYYVELGTG